MYAYLYINTYTNIYTYIHNIHIYIYIYICMCVCVCLCVCIYYVYIYIYINPFLRITKNNQCRKCEIKSLGLPIFCKWLHKLKKKEYKNELINIKSHHFLPCQTAGHMVPLHCVCHNPKPTHTIALISSLLNFSGMLVDYYSSPIHTDPLSAPHQSTQSLPTAVGASRRSLSRSLSYIPLLHFI